MRILMIGDVVGKPGRKALTENLKSLKTELKIDFVIANGENAAGGNGITKPTAQELFASGVDVLTMGNHVWDKREVFEFIEQETRIVRPANYPPGTPGRGAFVFEVNGRKVGVVNISGRVFLSELDDPFRKVRGLVEEIRKQTPIVIVDFHAEATSEKIAMGWYLDGKVSAVCGTHTHVQTADERILPQGTAYITDLGMTGPRDSVLGVEVDIILEKFLSQLPVRFEVASGPYQLNGVVIDIDEDTGEATDISRVVNFE